MIVYRRREVFYLAIPRCLISALYAGIKTFLFFPLLFFVTVYAICPSGRSATFLLFSSL